MTALEPAGSRFDSVAAFALESRRMAEAPRDTGLMALRVIAVLVALRSLTNLFKPFGTGSGLVFLGTLLTGSSMYVLAPLLGLYMLIWAYGLWGARPFALPMGIAYAALVAINILRFPFAEGLPSGVTVPMYAVYGLVAVGIPVVAVWLLARRRGAID
jgi:hypothetical protein